MIVFLKRAVKSAFMSGVLVGLVAFGQNQNALPFGPLISEQALTSFTIMGTGARALGMGGAFTGLADDATAVSFNPAGLAQILTPEVSFVGQFDQLTDGYVDFTSYDQVDPLPLTDSSILTDNNTFNFFTVTLPFSFRDRRWSFQLATHEIVNLNYMGNRTLTELSQDGVPLFELEQDVANSGSIRTYSGSISVQVTARTLLGLTVNRWDGNWGFRGLFSEYPAGQPELTESFGYHQENRLSGWNFDFGMLLKYEHFNVGIRYRSPSDLTYKLYADVSTVGIETGLQPVSFTETQLRWPSSLTLGISWKPTDYFVFCTDWGQTDWSRMNFSLPNYGERNFFDLHPSDQTTSAVSEDYHVGMEYLVIGGFGVLPLRAGWARIPQPAPDGVTGETIISEIASVGIGLKHRWFAMDLAYSRDLSNTKISRYVEPDDIANGALDANSSGRLDRKVDSYTLSFIIQFDKGSPFKRLLHKIFVGP